MISIPKNVYRDNLSDIFNKCNSIYHSTIKMKVADVKLSTHIDFNKENNKENLKPEVGDHVSLSKHKNIFAKGNTSNWYEEIFMIKAVKNTVPWTCYYWF